MEQANVKVSFYLKKSEADADGMCPVMARLNIGKYSEAAFSLKLRVPQAIWSSGRASGKSVKAKEINNRLDEIRAMALGIYAELSVVRDSVTADDVKSLLLGMAGEQTTLLSYFRTFIDFQLVLQDPDSREFFPVHVFRLEWRVVFIVYVHISVFLI